MMHPHVALGALPALAGALLPGIREFFALQICRLADWLSHARHPEK